MYRNGRNRKPMKPEDASTGTRDSTHRHPRDANPSDQDSKQSERPGTPPPQAPASPDLTQPGDQKPKVADPLPHVTLPQGGGAIRGIGEKFSVNAATGTSALSIPLALRPGRSGFTPNLGLNYDSGTGNGPFGFGWKLSVPSITRKTDKGLPQYCDADESDVFILAGGGGLVPIFA